MIAEVVDTEFDVYHIVSLQSPKSFFSTWIFMQKLTSDSEVLSYKWSTYITFLSSKVQGASWET